MFGYTPGQRGGGRNNIIQTKQFSTSVLHPSSLNLLLSNCKILCNALVARTHYTLFSPGGGGDFSFPLPGFRLKMTRQNLVYIPVNLRECSATFPIIRKSSFMINCGCNRFVATIKQGSIYLRYSLKIFLSNTGIYIKCIIISLL